MLLIPALLPFSSLEACNISYCEQVSDISQLPQHIQPPPNHYAPFETYFNTFSTTTVEDSEGARYDVLVSKDIDTEDSKAIRRFLEPFVKLNGIEGFQEIKGCYVYRGKLIGVFEHLYTGSDGFLGKLKSLPSQRKSSILGGLARSLELLFVKNTFHSFIHQDKIAFTTSELKSAKFKTEFYLKSIRVPASERMKFEETQEMMELRKLVNVYNFELVVLKTISTHFLKTQPLMPANLPNKPKELRKTVKKAFKSLSKEIDACFKNEPKQIRKRLSSWAEYQKSQTLLNRISVDLPVTQKFY